MDSVAKAADILRQAESNLRELVSKTATTGDYASVVQIASWAQAVADILKKVPAAKAEPQPAGPKPSPVLARAAAKESEPKKKQVRPGKVEYPKFFRHEDHLVRIAWSKKEKKEYQHKAPRAVMSALATAIAQAGKDGHIFSTDDILPLSDGEGAEIPSYQAYVGISLLKHLSLIKPHGRQGYSAPAPEELGKALDATWSNLPRK